MCVVCLCVGVHMCVHVDAWHWHLVSSSSALYFLCGGSLSWWSQISPCWWVWLARLLQGFLFKWAEITDRLPHAPGISGVPKSRSSCLHDRCFLCWATSLGLIVHIKNFHFFLLFIYEKVVATLSLPCQEERQTTALWAAPADTAVLRGKQSAPGAARCNICIWLSFSQCVHLLSASQGPKILLKLLSYTG